MQHQLKVGSFSIILDEQQRVLLCHRTDRDLWNLPGGKLEKGEAPWETALREIKEETGLDAKIIDLIGVYSKPEDDEIVFSFACEVIGGAITLSKEADQIEYFEIGKIPKNISPRQLERIHDLFNKQNKTVTKIQRGKSSIGIVSGTS